MDHSEPSSAFFFMIYNLYNNYLEVNIKFSTFALSLKNT